MSNNVSAILKYNNGRCAVLCSKCIVIIRQGSTLTDEDRKAIMGEIKLPSQYCDGCKEIIKNKFASVK